MITPPRQCVLSVIYSFGLCPVRSLTGIARPGHLDSSFALFFSAFGEMFPPPPPPFPLHSSHALVLHVSSFSSNKHVAVGAQVVNVSTSKTGKHGHAKANFTATDIFTGKKLEDVIPSTHTTSVPVVSRNEYQLLDIAEDGFCSLLTGKLRGEVEKWRGEVKESITDQKIKTADEKLDIERSKRGIGKNEKQGQDRKGWRGGGGQVLK